MLKNKKIIAALAVLVVIVVIFVVVRRRKKAEESDKSITGGGSSSGTGNATLPVASFPLTPYSMAGEYTAEAGSYGQQIANLQKICNKKFNKSLTVDGKFGPKTENAFRSSFGYPFEIPYSEEVYNGFIMQYGVGIV
ncbi:MAG: hypothetical protein E7067_08590 [Lentimicrobiaceae bacterium]|nr:hypothetical protein [Lentimicrobiaceae bacterium]